jgi:CheY-like chemotaxis protein
VLVAQTGWGLESDRRLAEEAGFDFHLTKPVNLVALRKILVEARHTTDA